MTGLDLASIKVEVSRPPTPVLWLDTWVYVKLAKLRRGEQLPTGEAQALLNLSDVVKAAVASGRLLCAEGDQDEEFAKERLETEIGIEVSRHTLGVRLNHEIEVADFLVYAGMKAYVGGETSVKLPASIFFKSGAESVAEVLDSRLIVTTSPGTPWTDRLRQSRHAGAGVFEGWRQENLRTKRPFEDVFEKELVGSPRAHFEALNAFFEDFRSGRGTLESYMAAQGPMLYHNEWQRLGGSRRGTRASSPTLCQRPRRLFQ